MDQDTSRTLTRSKAIITSYVIKVSITADVLPHFSTSVIKTVLPFLLLYSLPVISLSSEKIYSNPISSIPIEHRKTQDLLKLLEMTHNYFN